MEIASALMLAACPEQQTPPSMAHSLQGSLQDQMTQQPSTKESSQELSNPDVITPTGQIDHKAAAAASEQMDPVLLLQAFQLIESTNVWPASILHGMDTNPASIERSVDPRFTQGLDFILDIAVKVCHNCFPQPVTASQDAQLTQDAASTDKPASAETVRPCMISRSTNVC